MPKTKKSRREKQEIHFEREAEWLPPYPANESLPIINQVPDEVWRDIKLAKNTHKGWVRNLEDKVIFKQKESAFSSKPRLLDLPYDYIKQYYLSDEQPKVVILGVDIPSLEARNWFYILQFKKDKDAKDFLDDLQKALTTQEDDPRETYDEYEGDNSRQYPNPAMVTHPPRNIIEEDTRYHYMDRRNTEESRELLTREVENSQFDMKNFKNFPRQIPSKIYEVMDQRSLDEVGTFVCYDDKATFKERRESRSNLSWSVPYEDMESMNTFKHNKNHVLYAVNDERGRPLHYALFRFRDNRDTKELQDAYRATGRIVYDHDAYEPQRATSPDRYYRQGEYTIYNDERNGDRRPPSRPRVSNGFELSSMPNGLSRPVSRIGDSKNDRDLLMSMRDDEDEWETDMTYIKDDPYQGITCDKDGPIYLYVAHKVRD